MPFYCYRTKSGKVSEYWCHKMGEAPETIEIDGEVAHRDWQAERCSAAGNSSACWPMYSDAMGINPAQRKQMTEHSHKIGIPTNFTDDGRAIFTSASHRKRYCEALGYYDRNAGYGDPQPKRR